MGTQLQAVVWQKLCAEGLSAWVLRGEAAPAPAQSCAGFPLLRPLGPPMSLEGWTMGAASHLGCVRAQVQLGSVHIPHQWHGDGQGQGRGACVHVLLCCVRTQSAVSGSLVQVN